MLPVIVISGNTTAQTVIAARANGATEFLGKPITADMLYARITGIIELPRRFVRTEEFFGPDRRRSKKRMVAGNLRRATDPRRSLENTGGAGIG
jgi:two-component system chemotaxis response regulator CheY